MFQLLSDETAKTYSELENYSALDWPSVTICLYALSEKENVTYNFSTNSVFGYYRLFRFFIYSRQKVKLIKTGFCFVAMFQITMP